MDLNQAKKEESRMFTNSKIETNFEIESLKKLFANIAFRVAFGLYLTVVMTLIVLLVSRAEAKVIIYGSSAEQVRIKHGGPTIFRFPKAVQTITGASRLEIKPANAADPSYTVLAVTPRFTNGVNDVVFFLTDKTVVRAKIVVSPNDPAADGLYDFKSREMAENGEAENAPVITEIELLKAMVRDDTVSGYKVNRLSQPFPSKNSNSRVELIRIYKGSPFNGYVFKVTNTSWKKLVDVDVRHITVGEPNLAILSQSDEATIYPKGKGKSETLLRVVAKNTASSTDVILSMESEEAPNQTNSKKGE
jgi:hypothetical protein